jgi:two-component system, OmpR family, response regulator MprA
MLTPRVLVLDDDPAVRDSLQRAMHRYGYRAVAVADLDQARTVLKEGDIHALVLDVRLAGAASGLDLLKTIRAEPAFAHAPVIVVTGGVLSVSEEALITRFGAFLFYKPEGYDAMLKFLDTLTGRDAGH